MLNAPEPGVRDHGAFFFVELIRYAFLKRLSLDVIGDSVANVITFTCFVAIEYAAGAFSLSPTLYFWIYENFSLTHLSLNWVTIVTLLADLMYYWDHRMMHRIGVGWATHTVHHSSPHFNMSVAYRFGPLESCVPASVLLPDRHAGIPSHPGAAVGGPDVQQSSRRSCNTEVIRKLPKSR